MFKAQLFMTDIKGSNHHTLYTVTGEGIENDISLGFSGANWAMSVHGSEAESVELLNEVYTAFEGRQSGTTYGITEYVLSQGTVFDSIEYVRTDEGFGIYFMSEKGDVSYNCTLDADAPKIEINHSLSSVDIVSELMRVERLIANIDVSMLPDGDEAKELTLQLVKRCQAPNGTVGVSDVRIMVNMLIRKTIEYYNDKQVDNGTLMVELDTVSGLLEYLDEVTNEKKKWDGSFCRGGNMRSPIDTMHVGIEQNGKFVMFDVTHSGDAKALKKYIELLGTVPEGWSYLIVAKDTGGTEACTGATHEKVMEILSSRVDKRRRIYSEALML